MPADLQKARELFLHAVGKLPPEEWNGYVGQACGGDLELEQQVEHLLRVHREAGSFLDRPAVLLGATGACSPVAEKEAAGVPVHERPGTVIGPYKLLQQIGEGGMGTVFMAEQTQPVQRKVAVKVIKAGMDTRQVIARFEAERQALAMMDHVNIARVLDAGSTESGLPYFVMELVHGVTITKYCDDNRLTPRERLELFVPVCQAIQHAHQKGIIHRDIKPSNVMITLYDGKPVPKVIDFGVAKATEQRLTERTLFTQYGTMVGTLEYMSPEQAEMSGLGVDTRSDIFSLGVLLYELLTGSTPLTHKRVKDAAYAEVLRIIKEEEPPKPSTRLSESGEALASISAHRHMEPARLTRLVRGELDWIVMKTLEKDRNRRYETANGLARDLQRYLADEAVEACPPSAGYKLRKFARKNRKLLATIGGFAALLISGTAVSTWQWREAEAQRARAENKSLEADKNLREARKAVDDWFTKISQTTLLEAPGLEPLRKQLLEAALSYYQGLREQARNNPELRTDLAAAHMRMGLIYLVLDRVDDSVAAVSQGLELVEQLIKERPGDTDFPKRLAGFYKPSRELYVTVRGPSDPIKAVNTYQRLAEIWEQFARADPGTVEFKGDLAGSYFALSGLFQSIDLDRSLAYAAQSRTIWEKLVRAKPDVASYQDLLVLNYSSNAWVLTQKGRSQESEQLSRQAVRYFENLAQEFPTELSLRHSLAMVHNELAKKLRDAQPAEAEGIYRQTFGLLENLVAESPTNAHYRRELYTTYDNLAGLLQKAARAKEADEFVGKALAINEKLVLDFPDMRDYRQALANRYSALAGGMNESRPLEAEQAYRRALAVREKLMADFPSVDRYKADWNESNVQLINLLRNTGKSLEVEKLYRQAIVRFAKLAAANSSVPEYQRELAWSHNRLGILLRNAGRKQEADIELRKAQELWRQSPNPRVESAKKGVEKKPGPGFQWEELARAYYYAGDWKASLATLESRSGGPWQWFFLATAHWQLGDEAQGLGWYDRSLQAMEDWWQYFDGPGKGEVASLCRLRAETASVLGQPDPGTRPDDARALLRKGDALTKEGQREKAKHAYDKAINIYEKLLVDFPTVPVYRTRLVDLLNKTGRGTDVERVNRGAISRLEKLAAAHPKMILYPQAMGDIYRQLGEWDNGAAEYTKAIELKQDAWEAWSGRAFVHFSRQQWDRAIADYSKAIDLAPQVHTNWWHRGHAYVQLAQWDKAAANFGKVAEQWPDQAEAWYLRGVAFAQLNQPDKALADLRQAIAKGFNNVVQMKNDPKLAPLRTREDFGKLLEELEGKEKLQNQKKLDDAIAAFHKAIELDPKSAKAHTDLGAAFRAQGKLDEAIACHRKAIELDPKSARARNNLGHALAAQGKLDEAIACHRRSIELDPKSARARDALGSALGNKGWDLANCPDPKLRDPKRAVEVSKEALELAPQSVLVWQYLGWVQYRAGNWKASIDALETSCKLQNPGDCGQWIVMSLAHWKLANEKELPEQERDRHKTEALRWYARAVKQFDSGGKGGGSVGEAIGAFRTEAAELLGVKE